MNGYDTLGEFGLAASSPCSDSDDEIWCTSVDFTGSFIDFVTFFLISSCKKGAYSIEPI